ncbi:DMT family transporter [Pararhodobacter zhoushanensis]|uniref:DMT family transporter n=1 Tax=Pararhodobacter zhoushanensis TaxID=2479545 RepID=A0ABT3GVN3_9RHOB|nr:DMT family transporter [Pararhodobacter zhoushanensis]MCW1931596.1 DMT family transporter [Pararhodobacter zhoushanensis]
MEAWVLITIVAAGVQTLRFMLQKRLKGLGLSTGGATFSRFLFAGPLAVTGLIALMLWHQTALPPLSARFWAFAVLGGMGQIIATFCTVSLFSERSFAVGIAFTKTETIQLAAFSALVLGEGVSAIGFAAIIIGTAGVVLISRPPQGWRSGKVLNRATVLGIAAGALFGLSALGYRGATLEIANPDALFRATAALAMVTTFQVVAMGLWLRWREPGEMGRVLATWRSTLPVGVTGVLGSLGWFTAFALQNAAYVRSVGQVELLFSIAISALVFRERPKAVELAGIALLSLSIVAIVLLA